MTQVKIDGKNINVNDEDLDAILHQVYIEQKENDIAFMGSFFESEEGSWKSCEEMDAYFAQAEINTAKQKIIELLEEINKQETIIRVSKLTIQKYKRQVQTGKSNKRGRRTRSKYKEEIATKFTMKWVASLKDALEVKSCGAGGGLEKMVSSTLERNWRRWLKGDAIPSYTTLETLLNSKITEGKYAGKPLCNVPVTPNHNQMLTLLQFI